MPWLFCVIIPIPGGWVGMVVDLVGVGGGGVWTAPTGCRPGKA